MSKWRSILMGICLAGVASTVLADSLTSQRERYQKIKAAWDKKDMETVSHLMPSLRTYPLYPYLEYRWLTQDITQLSLGTVKKFVDTHPTLPPTKTLITKFINELANRQDWKGVFSLSPQPPDSVAAKCNYYYAKWAVGEQQEAWQNASQIWLSGKSLPESCDKLFTVWQQAGKQSLALLQDRLLLAFDENNSGLVAHLAKQLPDTRLATELVKLQQTPSTVVNFARAVPPSVFTHELTAIAFNRFSRQNADKAFQILNEVAHAQQMNKQDKLKLEESVAWRWTSNKATTTQASWRDGVIHRSQNESLIERRIRLALGEGDQQGLAKWLAVLPDEAKKKDEWQYWQAIVKLDGGKQQEGQTLLTELTKKRGFYPMAAAQKLGIEYPIKIDVATRPDAVLRKRPELARVNELMYWGLDNQARSEWGSLIKGSEKSQQEALARYAFERGWADLSVQATIVAKLWDHLEERFPLAWKADFIRQTADKSITTSYAMAIARQESAWNPQAQSSAGAMGLMQLMPKTAAHTVKQFNIGGYSNSSQLQNPQLNIVIGTRYLEHVYQTFGQNRIFASAAYNAGPSRVNSWLGNSAGRLDAIAFVESIPFNETRGYVKNVLVYDAFYRYFMKQPGPFLMDREWQRRY